MFEDEASKFTGIIAPDCINDLACLHEPRPASNAIASRQGELGVGKFYGWRIRISRVMRSKVNYCRHVATLDGPQEIPGLILQLIEVGPDWNVTGRHDEPPFKRPVRRAGQRGSLRTDKAIDGSGGLSPARGRVASCTPILRMYSAAPIFKRF
jgi:hypothetical protein